MPADLHGNIDKAYLEESWDLMKDLLDKEMPPMAPKPKPAGKKWLTLILLLLFAWTTYLYWPEPRADNTELEQQETPAKSEVVALNTLEQTLQQNENNFASTTSQNEKATGSSHAITDNQLVADQKVSNQDLFQKLNAGKYDQNFTKNKQATAKNIPVQFVGTKNIIDKKEELFIPGATIQNPLEASTDILMLPKEVEFLSNENIASVTFENSNRDFPVEQMTFAKRPLSLALKFEAIFDRRLISGKYLGIEIQKELNNQFSLLTGIGYSQYNKLNDSENSFKETRSFFDLKPLSENDWNALDEGMSIVHDADNRYAVIGVEQMNYLTIPVELVFAVNTKAKIIAGAGFSYLLNTKFSNSSSVEQWVSHEDGTVINNSEDLLGTAIQRFDISPSIGFSFQPVQNLRFDLKFRNGIIDISKDKFLGYSVINANKYLHLGVAYDFFKFR